MQIHRLRPFAEDGTMPIGGARPPQQQTQVWAGFMAWLLGKQNVELWSLQNDQGQVTAHAWIYLYPLKWGRYWLYAARGPLGGQTRELLDAVRKAHPKAVWLRWDPLVEGDVARDWQEGARPAHASFHPKSTLVLDLEMGQEALLAQMKPKGRYNIRLAAKKGVEVQGWTMQNGTWTSLHGASSLGLEEAVAIYTKISRETTSRDGFSGHGEAYFRAFLETMPEAAFLLLARAEGEWIAGGVFTIIEGTCTYYYGASSSAQRDKMAPYLVQWTAMQYAMAKGCHTYDFLGIATPGSTDKSDLALTGVTDFKTKFGGRIVTQGATWEKILDPAWFWAIRAVKSARPFLSRGRRS